MAYETATCETCGRSFGYYSTNEKGRFCSKSCWGKAVSEDVVCKGCGKTYKLPKSLTAKSRGMKNNYCSNACYESTLPSKVSFTCEACGNQFEVWPSRAARGNVRFCSKECSRKQSADVLRANNPKPSNKVKLHCETCGKEFFEVPSRIEKNARFCSNKCYGAWREQSGIAKGSRNSRYRDGSTMRTTARLRSAEWKRIADGVRAERGNNCQVCGREGGRRKLPVHHKIPWEISHDDNTTNLMVVCQSCHVILDNAYYNQGIVPYA